MLLFCQLQEGEVTDKAGLASLLDEGFWQVLTGSKQKPRDTGLKMELQAAAVSQTGEEEGRKGRRKSRNRA